MRNLLLAGISALCLSACSTTQLANAIAITTQVEGEIQGGIVNACDTYIPSLEQIGSIASTFVPGASALDTVINDTIGSVCTAVANVIANNPTAAAAAQAGRPITLVVNGVTISATYGGSGGKHHR
jgi:hypothetical protein